LYDLQNLRIYFSPCGIGLGHVARCVSISKEILERGGEILFSTYLEGLDYVNRHSLPVVPAPPLKMANDHSGSISLRASGVSEGMTAGHTFMQQLKSELGYIRSFEPDLVFSDSRLSSIIAANLLSIPVVLLINQFQPMVPRKDDRYHLYKFLDGSILTLLGHGWGQSNLILIPDFPNPYTISLDSLRIPEKYKDRVRFVGTILTDESEDVEDYEEVRELIGDGEMLIYAGISGPKPERKPLISLLESIFQDFPEKYKVIMSLGDPRGGSTPEKKGNLIKIPWIDDRFKYLKACDLVISRAGHETIMQSICYGKPSILIPVPNHTEQYSNARRAMELGVAEAIHQDSITKDNLLDLIGKISKNGSYSDNLELMNREAKLSNGIDNCLTAIKELVK
jgi:uncharacterized protein (TIGR00661 family)